MPLTRRRAQQIENSAAAPLTRDEAQDIFPPSPKKTGKVRETDSSIAFNRFVQRRRKAALLEKLHSLDSDTSSQEKRRSRSDVAVLRVSKRRKLSERHSPCVERQMDVEAGGEAGGEEGRRYENGDKTVGVRGDDRRRDNESESESEQDDGDDRRVGNGNNNNSDEERDGHREGSVEEGSAQKDSEEEESSGGQDGEGDVEQVQPSNEVASRRGTNKFPGEDYRPPQRVRFDRGMASRTTNITAHVIIKYDVNTATTCPCEDDTCSKLVNVGTWGMLGGGSRVCVHCGFKRKGDWQGVGYGFMGRKDLIRHLSTSRCKAKRGISTQTKSLREVIGERLYHKINDPTYALRKKDKKGDIKKYYKCFVCERVVGYRSRHTHHLNANHDTEPNDRTEGEADGTEGEGESQEE